MVLPKWAKVRGQLIVVLNLYLAAYLAVQGAEVADKDPDVEFITARMSEYKVSHEDAYLCTAVQLPDEPMKLIGIEPLAKQEIAHHMLLFGCEAPASGAKVWECHMVSPCGRGEATGVSHGEQVMYGWGKDAPGMHLPDGAGFSIGPRTGIRTAVLQVHYQIVRPEGDQTGVRLKMTRAPQPRGAGMMMWASGFTVPPRQPSHLVPNECCYTGFQPLSGFAFRVHAHALGRRIWMERDSVTTQGEPQLLVEQDPQEPQGFYPVSKGLRFLPGDNLRVTCEFNSSDRDKETHAGSGSKNEMCNMYMMVTSEVPYFMTCGNSQPGVSLAGPGGMHPDTTLTQELPSRWQPPPSLSAGVEAEHLLGQVSGADAGTETDTVWVLHRGERIWDQNTFVSAVDHHVADQTPIPVATVLQLDKDTGKVLRAWGAGILVMPHSIAVNQATGDVWVTDVGLHQALKFDPHGKLLASIGQKLQPGHDDDHLCKPTAVAFTRAGDVLVADGYCNSRVMHYTGTGQLVGKYQLRDGEMNVPHGLVVDHCEGRLHVADREAGTVHQFNLLQPPPTGDGGDSSMDASGGARRLLQANADGAATVEHEADTWDVRQHGLPYGITAGPYGSVLALCWDRDADTVALVLLDAQHR